MKRNQLAYLALGAIAFGLIVSPLTSKTNATQPPQRREVVILRGAEVQGTARLNLPGGLGDGYGYAGIELQNYSGSSNAPTYELPFYYFYGPPPYAGSTNLEARPRIPLSQALSDLLSQGYQIQSISQDNLRYTLVR